MPELSIRWSEHEARKPYARPFGVTFIDEAGDMAGSVAASGSELLYLRHFQMAVLTLAGELFEPARDGEDPQRAWLDHLSALLPALAEWRALPVSAFDAQAGRVFSFSVQFEGCGPCLLDAAALADYQEFQAAVAHQTGRLFRDHSVEDIADANARHAAWWRVLRARVDRPAEDERVAESWPWR